MHSEKMVRLRVDGFTQDPIHWSQEGLHPEPIQASISRVVVRHTL